MLAKEIKIKTIKKQREFITKQLNQITNREDGDCAYTYVGYIYPEVIQHFKSEGFAVKLVESDLMLAMTKGVPIYLFTVGGMVLSEEELKQAEEYYSEDNEDGEDNENTTAELMKSIFGIS